MATLRPASATASISASVNGWPSRTRESMKAMVLRRGKARQRHAIPSTAARFEGATASGAEAPSYFTVMGELAEARTLHFDPIHLLDSVSRDRTTAVYSGVALN